MGREEVRRDHAEENERYSGVLELDPRNVGELHEQLDSSCRHLSFILLQTLNLLNVGTWRPTYLQEQWLKASSCYHECFDSSLD